MAVRSTTFGGVTLTDDDAVAFRRQLESHPPKAEAVHALERGRAMAKEMREKGFVRLGKR